MLLDMLEAPLSCWQAFSPPDKLRWMQGKSSCSLRIMFALSMVDDCSAQMLGRQCILISMTAAVIYSVFRLPRKSIKMIQF